MLFPAGHPPRSCSESLATLLPADLMAEKRPVFQGTFWPPKGGLKYHNILPWIVVVVVLDAVLIVKERVDDVIPPFFRSRLLSLCSPWMC